MLSGLISGRYRFRWDRIQASQPYFPALYFQRVTTNIYSWCLRYPLSHLSVVCPRGSGTRACFRNSTVPCEHLLQFLIELLYRERSNSCRLEKHTCLVSRLSTSADSNKIMGRKYLRRLGIQDEASRKRKIRPLRLNHRAAFHLTTTPIVEGNTRACRPKV